jgi:hypothetical protein
MKILYATVRNGRLELPPLPEFPEGAEVEIILHRSGSGSHFWKPSNHRISRMRNGRRSVGIGSFSALWIERLIPTPKRSRTNDETLSSGQQCH